MIPPEMEFIETSMLDPKLDLLGITPTFRKFRKTGRLLTLSSMYAKYAELLLACHQNGSVYGKN